MRFPAPTIVALLLALAASAVAAQPGTVDFNRDIRPILTNNCFTCHGPDAEERKAELRLDTRAGALAERDGVAAIVAAAPDRSELIARVTAEDPDDIMPPRKKGKSLEPAQVDLLRRWIAQGAPYARHWSYVKPTRLALPQVSDASWPQNPIDHFILARLSSEGLAPSPPADRPTLIRRLSLDLTGLPPTLAEVDTFLADKSSDAYEKLVDRLLEKKTYGEHWARLWLDLARYADSAGYADDPPRTIWAFRDYVIRSLNANKPFDQFTIEQIAGDLLPDPTPEQLTATAFHRNTLTNNEGGTNDEEFRNVAVVDRVNTTMAVWMGTTIDCAQCHSHKYDPISQEEYFRLFAFFNNTQDADKKNEQPTLTVHSEDAKRRRAEIQGQIDQLRRQITAEQKKEDPKSTGQVPQRTGPIPIRYLRVQGLGKQMFLHLAEVQAFAGTVNVATRGKATQSSTGFGGPARLAIDGNHDGDYNKKSVSHTAQEDNPWIEVDLGGEKILNKVRVWNRTDGGTADRLKRFRLIALDAKRRPVWVHQVNRTPKPSAEAEVPGKFESLTSGDNASLAAYLASTDGKPASPLQKKIDQLQKQLAAVKGVTVPIMRERTSNRRKTHIQIRGNFLAKDKEVTEGVPAVFHSLPEGAAANRLALARWLVDPENPLTARVIANRTWEALFGIGLVRTSEEFGSQGELPSHPKLLDWLASELVAEGWDMKHLIKLLVTSAAYRQASRVTPDLLERDPDNRLLARGPRFRLSAEMIRDQALFAGGLLSPKMYGPPVKPPQPTLGVKAAFGSGIDWKTSPGEDRYRRGLYTTWRRSNPYPSMATFDAPNRETCTVRRGRTNTPLQALVTLNDPVFVEAAQGLARRMAAAAGSPSDKAGFGVRLCLARPPKPAELDHLAGLYAKARERLVQDPAAASELATRPLGPAPKGTDTTELAAWTVVGNVLLNLDEMFMKR